MLAVDWLVTCIVCGLAAQQIVETLRHGSLFSRWMQRQWRAFQERQSLWGKLWVCGFCLSHHAGALCLLSWLYLPYAGKPLVAWFATVRVAQWLNDYFHDYHRSPEKIWMDSSDPQNGAHA